MYRDYGTPAPMVTKRYKEIFFIGSFWIKYKIPVLISLRRTLDRPSLLLFTHILHFMLVILLDKATSVYTTSSFCRSWSPMMSIKVKAPPGETYLWKIELPIWSYPRWDHRAIWSRAAVNLWRAPGRRNSRTAAQRPRDPRSNWGCVLGRVRRQSCPRSSTPFLA